MYVTDRQTDDSQSCDGGTRVYCVMLWMRNVITHGELSAIGWPCCHCSCTSSKPCV